MADNQDSLFYTWPREQNMGGLGEWNPTPIQTLNQEYCHGKAHVFECAHVEKCQCGKIKRVMDEK